VGASRQRATVGTELEPLEDRLGRWWLAVTLVGCSTDAVDRRADAFLLPELLTEVAERPEAAAELCARLTGGDSRADCVLHGVERLAGEDAEAAASLCATLQGLGADECHFQLAERSGEVERCAGAGRFAEDCRMHAWSQRVPRLAEGSDPSEIWGQRIAAGAREMGFDPADPRPWIAAARHVLGLQLPLDRSPCALWPADAVEPCRHAGLGLFHDRINHLRDTRSWDCSEPPPEQVSFDETDRELAAVWADRRAEVCP